MEHEGMQEQPGILYGGRTQYVIEHEDPDYGPWVIEAEPPRKRDFWKVLRGKYRSRLRVHRSMTARGAVKAIEKHYSQGIREQLNQPSLLLFDDKMSCDTETED